MSAFSSDTVRMMLDSKPVDVPVGLTVAGAMMLASEQASWRVTRRDKAPRGLFCGIGSCFDCLVTVNGESQLRACLVPVAEGMRIETEENAANE